MPPEYLSRSATDGPASACSADDRGTHRDLERGEGRSLVMRRRRRNGEPARVVVVRLLPAPRIASAVDRFARPGGVVSRDRRIRDHDWRVAGVDEQLPAWSRIDQRCFTITVALDEERRAIAVLRDGTRGAPVPDDRGEHVSPGMQLRPDVDRLVPPMRDVGTLWAR